VLLVAEEDHLVGEQGLPDRGDGRRAEVAAEPDAPITAPSALPTFVTVTVGASR
jgi:hypothetical protein